MIITEHGEKFLEAPDSYMDLNMNELIIITGPDVIKNNSIYSTGTLFLKNNESQSLFIADHCTPEELLILKNQIKNLYKITSESSIEIPIEISPSLLQENLIYLAYSDPNIRPIIYSGSVTINDSVLTISDGKILTDGKELDPYVLLKKIWRKDDTDEKTDMLTLLNKKIEEHEKALAGLKIVLDISLKETTVPKIVTIEEEERKALIYLNDKRYTALPMNTPTEEGTVNYSIKSDLSWEEAISELINSTSMSKTTAQVDTAVADDGLEV